MDHPSTFSLLFSKMFNRPQEHLEPRTGEVLANIFIESHYYVALVYLFHLQTIISFKEWDNSGRGLFELTDYQTSH